MNFNGQEIVKNLSFGEDARDRVFGGIEKLTKAVSSTLGASGKCVILENDYGSPIITKDGVTVANSIVLENPLEELNEKYGYNKIDKKFIPKFDDDDEPEKDEFENITIKKPTKEELSKKLIKN